MNTLDINACNVQEMDVAEMQQIEGGGLYKIIAKALEAIGVYEVLDAFCEGFTEGVQEGFNDQQNKK
jgi:hypothetical protein